MNPVSIPGIVIYLSLLGVEYNDHQTDETVAPVYKLHTKDCVSLPTITTMFPKQIKMLVIVFMLNLCCIRIMNINIYIY